MLRVHAAPRLNHQPIHLRLFTRWMLIALALHLLAIVGGAALAAEHSILRLYLTLLTVDLPLTLLIAAQVGLDIYEAAHYG